MKKILILTIIFAVTALVSVAQEKPVTPPDTLRMPADTSRFVADSLAAQADTVNAEPEPVYIPDLPEEYSKPAKKNGNFGSDKPPMNMFKVNLSALFLKTYSLQYERVLSRTVSIAVSGAYMPETNLPYTDQIIKWSGATEPEEIQLIESVLKYLRDNNPLTTVDDDKVREIIERGDALHDEDEKLLTREDKEAFGLDECVQALLQEILSEILDVEDEIEDDCSESEEQHVKKTTDELPPSQGANGDGSTGKS